MHDARTPSGARASETPNNTKGTAMWPSPSHCHSRNDRFLQLLGQREAETKAEDRVIHHVVRTNREVERRTHGERRRELEAGADRESEVRLRVRRRRSADARRRARPTETG